MSISTSPSHYVELKTGLAVASLVLGLLSLLLTGFLTAIPGIITGHLARSRATQFPNQYGGSGMALGGLILSYIVLVISILIIAGIVFLGVNGHLDGFMDMFLQEMQK